MLLVGRGYVRLFIAMAHHLDVAAGLLGYKGDAKEAGYVLEFTPGEPVSHVGATAPKGEFYKDAKGHWRSLVDPFMDESGVVRLPHPDEACEKISVLKWKFLIFPRRMKAQVEETCQRLGHYMDIRDGLPFVKPLQSYTELPYDVHSTHRQGDCSPHECWVYFEAQW